GSSEFGGQAGRVGPGGERRQNQIIQVGQQVRRRLDAEQDHSARPRVQHVGVLERLRDGRRPGEAALGLARRRRQYVLSVPVERRRATAGGRRRQGKAVDGSAVEDTPVQAEDGSHYRAASAMRTTASARSSSICAYASGPPLTDGPR